MSLDGYRKNLDFRERMKRLTERTARLRCEQEGETDEERRAADYGLTHRDASERPMDNVIAVDFASRTRVSRPRQGGRA